MSGAGGSADASSPCLWCRSYRYYFLELPSADFKLSSCSAPRTDRAVPRDFTKGLLLDNFKELFSSLDGLVFDEIKARLCLKELTPVWLRCSANSILKRLCDLFDPYFGCDLYGETPCKQTGRSKTKLLNDAADPPIEKSSGHRLCATVAPGGKRLDPPASSVGESCVGVSDCESDESDQFGVSHGGKRLDPPSCVGCSYCDSHATGETNTKVESQVVPICKFLII